MGLGFGVWGLGLQVRVLAGVELKGVQGFRMPADLTPIIFKLFFWWRGPAKQFQVFVHGKGAGGREVPRVERNLAEP